MLIPHSDRDNHVCNRNDDVRLNLSQAHTAPARSGNLSKN